MALPANIGTGTVKGHLIDSAGNPLQGTLMLTPNFVVLKDANDTPGPTVILPKAVPIVINSDGTFSKDAQATDDTDATPFNWTYTLTSAISGATLPSMTFSLPQGTTVDIGTLVQVSPSGGTIINGSGAIVVDPTDTSGLADGTLIVRTA